MDYSTAKNLLEKYGQIHLLQYYNELDDAKRRILLDSIERADFSVIDNIRREQEKETGDITPISALSIADINLNRIKYESAGEELLKQGKVAAVMLAGGQGTRLGYDKPKGTFNIGEKRNLYIFEQLINNLMQVTNRVCAYFHLFIMTSEKNDAYTQKFFKDKNYFGYPADKVHFYKQKEEIVCDFNGKVFLDEKHRVLTAPNGNGGWYSSLVSGGLKEIIEKEGVEWLNVFAVDNVLQKICDPAFVGATVLSGCNCGAKVVSKSCADEKVGALCFRGGKPSVIEYFEMPEELKNLRGEDGELTFRYGVTLNYLFNVETLNGTLLKKLPYHIAKKAVPHIENGEKVEAKEPCGCKFETLVVDMVNLAGSCLAFEIEREKEFAPVKNAKGVDSVESARVLLKKNGIKI